MFKEITNKENELSNVEKSLEGKNISINKLNSKIQTLTGNIAKTVGYLEELNQEKADVENKINEVENIYSQKQKEKDQLEKELNLKKEKELEYKGLLNALKEKIGFIQNLIDNLEGVSNGAKALLENNDWAAGKKTILAHTGNSSDEYRFAVEAALKNNLNDILIETMDDLKNGIEYLKSNDIGKASFYVSGFGNNRKKNLMDKIHDYGTKRKAKKLVAEKGFVGRAVDFVQTEEKWKSFFDKLLDKYIVVDTLDTAFRLSEKYPGFNFTTLNGDYVDNSGSIEAGSEPKPDDSIFGRKQFLEKLKNEFPLREAQLEKLREGINRSETRINGIDLNVLSERGKLLVNDLSNVEKQIAQFEYEKQKAEDEIEKTRAEISDLVTESNNLDNERNKLSGILEEQEKERTSVERQRAGVEEEVKTCEESYGASVAEQNRINLDLERLLGEKKNTENAIKRAEDSIETIGKSIAKREFDINSSGEEIESLKQVLEEKGLDIRELEDGKNNLLKEESEIDSAFKTLRTKIGEKETAQNGFRKEREAVSDEIHSCDMKLNELGMKTENLRENIKENYSVTLEAKTFDDLEEFDFKQRTEEVHTLKQQVRNLGPINLLAYSEYEEEKERFDFLNKQRNDLLESERDIIKTIEEINQTAQTLFMDTFEQIRQNFIDIFRGLFNPGDEADLKLEEAADPLEAKIEIIAKPKGKRPTSIELLSGGEKTLTAIALLFAIYLVKPSPFCILDEVDAPLDDANIDRFTKIIKDFSSSTQFIVVTHNKRTMEAASTLYGVTMQEEGVSKLVSVRFNEELDFVS